MSANNDPASLQAENEHDEGGDVTPSEGEEAAHGDSDEAGAESDVAGETEGEPEGLTHAELSARVLNMSRETRNVEEPLGTAQWPTGQLSESASRLLAAAIRRRLRAA